MGWLERKELPKKDTQELKNKLNNGQGELPKNIVMFILFKNKDCMFIRLKVITNKLHLPIKQKNQSRDTVITYEKNHNMHNFRSTTSIAIIWTDYAEWGYMANCKLAYVQSGTPRRIRSTINISFY